MILSNTETIPDYNITHHIGLVQGNTVRAKHVGRGANVGGGAELLAYGTAVL